MFSLVVVVALFYTACAQNCSTPPTNIIVMVGDGNGWEMTRAAAIHKQLSSGATGTTLSDFYTQGKGEGLSFQTLPGYAITVTTNTYIDGDKGNSALQGNPIDHNTGEAPAREGFSFSVCPASVNGFYGQLRSFDESIEEVVNPSGNMPYYSPQLGSSYPWLPLNDPEYIKALYPDSAGTSTGLNTGVKTYVGAIGVDIYEQALVTSLEVASAMGKSTGIVTSVPYNHATPAAAAAHVSQRNKYHEGTNQGTLDEFNNTIDPTDNIFMQYMEITQPTVILGGGHPLGSTEFKFISEEGIADLRNGSVYPYTFLERSPDAVNTLMQTAANLDVNSGDKLFGLYGCRGQSGNLCWRTAANDYSNAGGDQREDVLDEFETEEEFIKREVNENPGLNDLTKAALSVLEKDEDGFWLMIEGGDIDWAAHSNHLDNLIGAVYDFQDSVQTVIEWIEENGGFNETLLIVTADHDHYLTLNDNFPELLAASSAKNLTENEDGHYWGTPEQVWGTHTTRPVPTYFAGACSEQLNDMVGASFEVYGEQAFPAPGMIDQVHIGQLIFDALAD
eukprot:TRINITY_DN44_c0_g1_i2.p1 TRINITY_DN44_c0_g1~~TRINITY_DN44_c0_g1_i2.p1  ORF type:complete len:601 (+),score=103.07 TRINITY_DN44_c0_g1_i2:123-1805(+)